MKKFKKYSIFGKKPSYVSLLAKYNALVVEHETLIEEVKNDLYDKIFERIFRETERLDLYEEENFCRFTCPVHDCEYVYRLCRSEAGNGEECADCSTYSGKC